MADEPQADVGDKPPPFEVDPTVVFERVAKVLGLIPLTLGVLGIVYDVGYFARIGLDFFPLFSLTEHLLFAIQAIPLLLALYVVPWVFFAGIGAIVRTIAKKRLADQKYAKAAIDARVFTVSFLIVGGIAEMVRWPDAWPAGALLVFFGFMILFISFTEGVERLGLKVLGTFTVVTLLAFGFGYAIAAAVLNPKEALSWPPSPLTTISLEAGPPISGRVLRSGAQGLLVFNSLDKSVQFKKWDEVRGLEIAPSAKPTVQP